MLKPLKNLLAHPDLYRLLQFLVARPGGSRNFVQQWIRPTPGCALLDIGCGPGRLLDLLPPTLSRVVGLDHDAGYIADASARYGDRAKFYLTDAAAPFPVEPDSMDLAVCIGVLHHLNDEQARELARNVVRVLKPGGRFITCDPVRVPGQHPIARWMMDADRGRFIRNPEGYSRLVTDHFLVEESSVESGYLRLPYQHWMMRCQKPAKDADSPGR